MKNYDFVFNLLSLLSKYDLQSYISWDEDVNFYFGCNDCFYYASADAEDIETLEDVELLRTCIDAVLKVNPAENNFYIAILLYCSRKRGVTPIRPIIANQYFCLFEKFESADEQRETIKALELICQ